MKIPAPHASPSADAEIEALLAAADAKIQARASGGGEDDAPPPPVDLDAYALRNAVWLRPWSRKTRPAPLLDQGVEMGEPLPGDGLALRSRPGDATGPWLALRLVGPYDPAAAVAAFRAWWEAHRAEFIDAGDYQAEAGHGDAGQAWLDLVWREVVSLGGRARVFPAAGSDQEPLVRAMLDTSQGLGYDSAWRRATRRSRHEVLTPQATAEQAQRAAVRAVGHATHALEETRAATRRARAERDQAREALERDQEARPVRAWLHARGWVVDGHLAQLHGTLSKARKKLELAKATEKTAGKELGDCQTRLEDAGKALKKALQDGP